MRFLTVLFLSLLAFTSCAGPAAEARATPSATAIIQETPTSVPAGPTSTPIPVAFKDSLLGVQRKDNSYNSVLVPVDPNTGLALPGYEPIVLRRSYSFTFSPDQHILATVSYPNSIDANGSLLLIDLPTWKTQKFELKLNGWVRGMVFSPDGGRLAIAHGDFASRLTVIDVHKGNIIAQIETEPIITQVRFTSNGDALIAYGSVIDPTDRMESSRPQVLLLDASDLKTRWSAELKDVREGLFPKNENITPAELYQPGNSFYLSPGLAFAPDQDVLYIVHADSEQLTTVDFDKQQVRTVEIQSQLSWFERLLSLTAGIAHAKSADGTSKQAIVSPDGQVLYVVGVNNTSIVDQRGNSQITRTPLGLEIIQTSDMSRMGHVDTDATELSLSPDGRFLYLRNWVDTSPWTEIFDTVDRQIIARKEAFYATPSPLMNGQFLLASTYVSPDGKYHMSVRRPSDLGVQADWMGTDFIDWLPAP